MIGNRLPSSLFAFLAIVTLATGKPPPPPDAPWAKFVSKPVYSRSLGPPPMPGVSTFAIPYVPKPTMFPKFVDPRIMIAKKTDLLANMFGGIGPGFGAPGTYAYPGGMYGPEDVGSEPGTDESGATNKLPILYASGFDPKTSYVEDFSPESSYLKRGLFGPTAAKTPFGGAFAPKKPFGGPFFGAGGFPDSGTSGGSPFARSLVEPISPKTKKAEYLDSLFKAESSTDVTEPQGTATRSLPSSDSKIAEIFGKPDESIEKKSEAGAASSSPKDLTKRMIAEGLTIPKQYLPGMFGPMGPAFGPPSGVLGPDAFMSKKSMFLDTLFKNLATSTISPVTDVPEAPKSTVVPPGFWIPDTLVPGPGAYNAKVGAFLDKLFDSLKLNASATAGDSPLQALTYEESITAGIPGGSSAATRSLPADYSPYLNEATRSLADPEAVITAKDKIVSSIIAELGVLKDDMVSTFNGLVAFQKNISAPATGAKPFKPFPSPFWPQPAAAAFDVGSLPYKQRMILLDQVFDMLTELQTNVTAAVNEAVKSSYEDVPAEPEPITTTIKPEAPALNISVLEAIQAKLNDLGTIGTTISPKFSRALPESQTSFWVAYPGGPTARRNLNEDRQAQRNGIEIPVDESDNSFNTAGKDSRAIKMQMHQGYQSLPPGTIESVQAGGGSAPGHEGGGVNLLGAAGDQDYRDYLKWQDFSKIMENNYQNANHHHHGRRP